MHAGTYEFSLLGQHNLQQGVAPLDYHEFCFGSGECGFPELINGSCQSSMRASACHRHAFMI